MSLLAPDLAAARVLRTVSGLEIPNVMVTDVVPLGVSVNPLAVAVSTEDETLVTVPTELSVNGTVEESVNPVPTRISSSAPAVVAARPTSREPAAVVNPELVITPCGAISADPTFDEAGRVVVPSEET
jgi:hypothetical protein